MNSFGVVCMVRSDLVLRQPRRFLSFKKLSEWYQDLWRPPPPRPPYRHVCQIGDPVLRARAEPVAPQDIKSQAIQNVIRRMTTVMRQYDAAGLAAPQIGVPLRIIVVEFGAARSKEFDPDTYRLRDMQPIPLKVFINPELRRLTTEQVSFPESCESVKGFAALVPRYTAVSISGLDPRGDRVEWKAQGWAARIVQHEMDHLEGRLFTDLMQRDSLHCAYWQSVNIRSGRFSLTFAPFKRWKS